MLYVKGVPTKIVSKRTSNGGESLRLGVLCEVESEFGISREIIPLGLPENLAQAYKVYAEAIDDAEYLIPVRATSFNDRVYYRVVGVPLDVTA